MLDLETMGNGPHAAIVAIGAVLFDDITEQLGESFYTRIDLASAVNLGGVIDADTVQWWLRQSADAREQVDGSQPAVHMAVALADFADYIAQHSDARRVRMWGNGAAFDNVILASSYRRAGIIAPWRYTNDRCYRTVKADHLDIELQHTGTHHNALDDAINQAQHLIAMRNRPGPATAPQAAQQPSDEELRAMYQAAAPGALAWPWPDGLRAVIRQFSAAPAATAAPVASVRCNPGRDPADELACAEAVLDSLSVGLDLQETAFDCVGDYITAVVNAIRAPAAPVAQPKSLDDPHLQRIFSDAIRGALALGAVDECPPPIGHWLGPWWQQGRAVAAAQVAQPVRQPMTSAQVTRLWNNAPEHVREDVKSCAALLRLLRFFESVYGPTTEPAAQPARELLKDEEIRDLIPSTGIWTTTDELWFARAVERACSARWGVRLEGGAA